MRKHQAFLNRLGPDGFRPVPPLSCFSVVHYHSPTVANLAPITRPFVAFEIHRTIEDQERPEYRGRSRFRPFHHVRDVARVAGMLRHAAGAAARQLAWSEERIASAIDGHGTGKNGQGTSDERLQFLPVPSLTPVGVSGIRRALVVAPPGFDLSQLRRHLHGRELTNERTQKPIAMLSFIPNSDKGLSGFTATATTWRTVTPVILPGYDDPDHLRRKLSRKVSADQQKQLLARLDTRVLDLLCKAMRHAGLAAETIEQTVIDYRAAGFLPHTALAGDYELPPLTYPRYHVSLRFPHPVAGPLALGAGRYRGMGLFAATG